MGRGRTHGKCSVLMMWLLTIMTDGPTSVYAVQQPMTSALCRQARRLEAERSHDELVRLGPRYAVVGSSGLDAAPSREAMTGGRGPRGSELLFCAADTRGTEAWRHGEGDTWQPRRRAPAEKRKLWAARAAPRLRRPALRGLDDNMAMAGVLGRNKAKIAFAGMLSSLIHDNAPSSDVIEAITSETAATRDEDDDQLPLWSSLHGGYPPRVVLSILRAFPAAACEVDPEEEQLPFHHALSIGQPPAI